MEPLRIVIADNQPETRSALKLVIELEPGFTVAGELDEANGLAIMAQTVCADVILLDWQLRHQGEPSRAGRSTPHPGGQAELVRALRLVRPSIKILALSGRPEVQSDALAAGADAFVCKGESPDRLLEALRSLCEQHIE
jgi:DNA-binding NarL/FixJ family response regulator